MSILGPLWVPLLAGCFLSTHKKAQQLPGLFEIGDQYAHARDACPDLRITHGLMGFYLSNTQHLTGFASASARSIGRHADDNGHWRIGRGVYMAYLLASWLHSINRETQAGMAGLVVARVAFLLQTRRALWPCRPCCALPTACAVRLDRWSLVAFHWCLADPERSARAMHNLNLRIT